MAPLPAVSEVQVEAALFPPTVKPPGSSNTLFLGGAGVRGVVIDGNFIKVTAIGVYLEAAAIPLLAEKWKGKTADELEGSLEFFGDIVRGPYEKFMRVTLLVPLTGQMYSDKVSEGCVAIWKAAGIYTDAEADAVEKFKATFKEEKFGPGNSILFTQSPLGTLTIGFSEDGSVPEAGKAVIANKPISETVLDTIIGEHAVSPAAKKSLAARVSQLLGELDNVQPETPEEVEKKQDQTEEVLKEIK